MSGWIILGLLFAAALLGLRLLGLRGPLLQLGAAALLLGSAGYALQGSPGTAGSPRVAQAAEPPVPLTRLRHAFFGQFSGAEPWLRIAEALASRGKTQDAVGALRSAVREHPGDPALWIGLGNALVDHSKGLTPASELAFRRAAELAPGHPAPPFFMGLALARSGDREGALRLWQAVLANAPAEASWKPLVEEAVAVLEPPKNARG
ncbi:MAG TPA: tetratricopeptide repeat protein [Sphingomicrobium sp.]|nr:tetratricopeptide repeat protein [Sphingomicrobium sp.]